MGKALFSFKFMNPETKFSELKKVMELSIDGLEKLGIRSCTESPGKPFFVQFPGRKPLLLQPLQSEDED